MVIENFKYNYSLKHLNLTIRCIKSNIKIQLHQIVIKTKTEPILRTENKLQKWKT